MSLEPLNIDFKGTTVITPQYTNDADQQQQVEVKRSIVSLAKCAKQDQQRNRSPSEDVKSRIVAEKTQVIYDSLGEEQRKQLHHIFCQVPINDGTNQLIS